MGSSKSLVERAREELLRSLDGEPLEDFIKRLHVVSQEVLPFVIQRRDGRHWADHTTIRGRSIAFDELNRLKREEPGSMWRAIPKNEADKLKEGMNLGMKLAKRSTKNTMKPHRRVRLPLLALPEHL